MKWARRIDALVLVLCAMFAWWLMSSTFGFAENAIQIDSKLYSDFGAHLPLIRSFSLGWNFPPAYPFFFGEPIRYHYLFYLLVGFTERLGVRIDLALNLWSAGGFLLLLWMIYQYTLHFFRSRAAGVLALILFLCNGSLAWVEYFQKHGWTIQALLEIPTQQQFASFGPWSGKMVSAFWNWNIFTNQRHLGLSYGLLLLLMFPLVTLHKRSIKEFLNRWRKRFLSLLHGIQTKLSGVRSPVRQSSKKRWLWAVLIVVGFSLFPLLHQAAYIMIVPLAGVWIVLQWPRSKSWLPVYLLAVLISLIVFRIAIPQSGSLPSWHPGYLSTDVSVIGMLYYWWFNLGLYVLLLPVVLIWSAWRRQWWLWTVLPFFVAANMFQFSPDIINNHKLVTFFVISLQFMTAGFLIALVRRSRWFIVPVSLIVIGLTFSGIMDIFPVLNDYDGEIEQYTDSEVQQWILKHTLPQAQFLSASYMYNPASLTGRFLYLDYGYHAWSMGYNDRDKRANLAELWAESPEFDEWCSLLKREKIDAIIVGPSDHTTEDGRINVDISYVKTLEPTYFDQKGWNIWLVDTICAEYEKT